MMSFISKCIFYLKAQFQYFVLEPIQDLKLKKRPISEEVHSLYRLAFAGLLAVSLFLMPFLSKDYGISWDEKIQYDYGNDILKYYLSFGEDTTIFNYKKAMYEPMSYYGCSFDVITSTVNYIFPSLDDFKVRHFFNALYGVAAILFVGLIGYQVSNWRTAFLASLFTILTPSFFGHAMNNPKDIPFAAAFVFAIYFLIKVIKQMPKPAMSDVVFAALGIGWAISIRAGGIMLLAYITLFLGLAWLGFVFRSKFKNLVSNLLQYLKIGGIIVVLGYFSGMIIWPYAQKDPLSNPLDALQKLSKVNYLHTYENFEGKRIYMQNVPWYYISKFISISTPLFVLIGAGLMLLLLWIPKAKISKSWVALLLFCFVFPIAYTSYKDSMLYNGWRHFLFAYLFFVVLAAMGWDALMRLVQLKWIQYALGTILGGLCIRVLIWMFLNHPYEYVYFNECIGGLKGAYGNYETDYYSVSVKEAIEWIGTHEPNIQKKKTIVVTNNELLTATHWAGQISDSIDIRWTRDYERGKQPWDYAIFTTRTYAPFQLKHGGFPPKGTIHTITADGVILAAIVKRENKWSSQGHTFVGKNQFDSASVYFQKAVAYDPLDQESWRMLGLAYLNLNASNDALTVLNKALELHPDDYMAYYLRSFIYRGQHNFDAAESDLKMAVKCRINYPDAHAALGDMYMEKNYSDFAIKAYTKAIEFGSQDASTFNSLGSAYLNAGSFDIAINVLQQALSLNPSFTPAYENLALAFEKKGDPATAAQVREYGRQNGR